jgi:cardiolipin synthase
MEAMYLEDLANSTEIVLEGRRRLRPARPVEPRASRDRKGSATRAAAGALRIGNVLGAALTNRRVLEPVEMRLVSLTGFALFVLAMLFVIFPRALAYPASVVLAWFGVALLVRAIRLSRKKRGRPR